MTILATALAIRLATILAIRLAAVLAVRLATVLAVRLAAVLSLYRKFGHSLCNVINGVGHLVLLMMSIFYADAFWFFHRLPTSRTTSTCDISGLFRRIRAPSLRINSAYLLGFRLVLAVLFLLFFLLFFAGDTRLNPTGANKSSSSYSGADAAADDDLGGLALRVFRTILFLYEFFCACDNSRHSAAIKGAISVNALSG
jgi:hypothetical protein